MNKKVFGRKLSRSRPAREALFATLMRAMILNGKIVTTHAKAKAIQGDLDHLVTLAKKGDLSSRRRALSMLDNATESVRILFQKIAPAFSSRNSGFTRTISLPTRKGDNAKMMRMEWTDKVEFEDKKNKDKNDDSKAKTAKKKTVKKESSLKSSNPKS
jgi:large subunit ribosomal protein L17